MTHRHLALAQAAAEEKDWDRVRAHAQEALAGGHNAAHEFVGTAAWMQRDFKQAVAAFEALEQPGPHAMAALARLYLLTGDNRNGWHLVWHGCRSGAFGPALYDTPRWEGGEVDGKHVAVWGMGCGDDMLFARFVPALAARGARVTVNCRHALLRLFTSLPGVSAVLPLEQPAADVDLHVHLAELPALFGVTRSTAWPGQAYLRAAAPVRFDGGAFNVGIVWAADSRHMEAQERSALLSCMRPLSKVPGVRLHALQMGAPRRQLYPPPVGLEDVSDLTPGIRDFADTANLIAGLDLVISIDTSVANLAGAMGARMWAAVPFIPDWRWSPEGSTTPWYPSATVFRQDAPGDWDGVFSAMVDTLTREVRPAATRMATVDTGG